MEIPFLDLSRIDKELKKALKSKFSEILDKGMFSGGQEVDLFEKAVSDYLNSPHAIACANGTDALELALRALGIGQGDEVIVPALTWVSTAEVVLMVGAKPIFWDTDENGLLAGDWTKAISKKTKAVIPVHLYGQMVEMKTLLDQASKLNLHVVEDAAQAFGAEQYGKAAGTWGDVGCLSFYPTKNLGALGEAGMCLTSNTETNKSLRLLLNHGQTKRDEHESVGRNSRIDSLQAGFLNVMLEKWETHQKIRKQIAAFYKSEFKGISDLKLPTGTEEQSHNCHLFVIQTSRRDQLKEFLKSKGIGTAIHYPAILPDLKPYLTKGDFSNARAFTTNGLSLPLNAYLSQIEIEYIVDKIKDFFRS